MNGSRTRNDANRDRTPAGNETDRESGLALGGTDDAGTETILLPVGAADEERVATLAETAAEMAGLMQTTVRVLHVFTDGPFERALDRAGDDPDSPPDPDEVARSVDPVRAVVDELAPPLRDWGMTLAVEGRVGDSVSEEIVAAAADVDAKRILITGRRRTPVGKVVYGSTAQQVLLDAPCPVTFVREL